MSDIRHRIDTNGLIVIGATLALLGIFSFSAGCIPRDYPFNVLPSGLFLIVGCILVLWGGAMLRIGIRHRPKDSDLSVPMVVGVEMVLCGGLLNWVCFEWLRHSYGVDTFSDYLPAMIIASTLIFGGIVVLCWVILQNK